MKYFVIAFWGCNSRCIHACIVECTLKTIHPVLPNLFWEYVLCFYANIQAILEFQVHKGSNPTPW